MTSRNSSFNDENPNGTNACGEKLFQTRGSSMKHPRKNFYQSDLSISNKMAFQMEKSDSVMPQKTYVFWILIFIIFFMASVNFLLLVIMMNVLNIGESMESMEMVTKEDVVKFFGDVDIDNVIYDKGEIEGFQNIPVLISGNDGPIVMTVKDPDTMASTSKFKIVENEIILSDINKFDVIDPLTRMNIFSTDHKNFHIPKGVSRLDVEKLHVNSLISPLDSNLTIKLDTGVIRLRGNEGVSIGGKDIIFRADGDIYLNSENDESIHFLSDKIRISNLPRSSGSGSFTQAPLNAKKYKLCVCMPQGILFQVMVPKDVESHKACSYVDPDRNPCSNDDQAGIV